jgi:hypothetical protein
VSANSTISASVGPELNVPKKTSERKCGMSIDVSGTQKAGLHPNPADRTPVKMNAKFLQDFSGAARATVVVSTPLRESVGVCGNPGGKMDLKGKSRASEKLSGCHL